ncbi:MAG: glutathione S-transferase N-terminal domain-containing protein [Methylovirgula sp.]
MMILRSSPPSPFGRKVKIAAALAGVRDKIEIVVADTTDPNEVLRKQNPLGKIPTLILEDGTTLYDSRVIVEYLDWLAGGDVVIPTEPKARFAALTRAALADGLLDAALLLIYEDRFRAPEFKVAKWTDYQAEKIARALDAFAAAPPTGKRDVAHIGLACALGYLDLRFGGGWRETHKNLVDWLAAFEADVPAFAETRVVA